MKSLLHPLVVFAAVTLIPLHAEESGILGTWRSTELNTGSSLQVAFTEREGKLTMQLWSSMGGDISKDSRSHRTEISASRAKALSTGDSSLKIPIDYGFKETIYEVFKTDTGLRLDAVHQYTDNSGRDARTETLNFVRGEYSDAVIAGLGEGVPEVGWLGTWKNRDEGTQGIAQLLIQDLQPVMMSTWGIAGNELSSKRGAYVRLPLSSEEAASLEGKPEIEATFDHGWAIQIFTMELHEDGITLVSFMDYADPERGDQEFEYEFIRGIWED